MPFDTSYWTKLATEAGLSEDTVKAIAGNEKLMSSLASGYKRQDEFSREMDQSRRAQQEAAAAKAQYDDLYGQNVRWLAENQQRLTQFDQLAELVRTGQLTPAQAQQERQAQAAAAQAGNGQQPQQPKYLTAEDQAAGFRNFWTLNKQLRQAEARYADLFGKPMPITMIDELEALAQKPENSGRALPDLFSEHISKPLEEHRAALQKEREERIRKEAHDEGYAKGQMREPSSNDPDNVSPFWGRRTAEAPKAPSEGDLMRNFVSDLSNAQHPTA